MTSRMDSKAGPKTLSDANPPGPNPSLRNATRNWLARFPRAAPITIFLLVVAITILSVFAIERGENAREEAQLGRVGHAMSSALERRGATSSSYLRAGAALFSTMETVEPRLFSRFVNELRIDSDYRGADGIGWAEAISPEDIPQFEEKLAEDRIGSPSVFPTLEQLPRDKLVPIRMLYPDTVRNGRAIGYDMYSEPVRRAAMDKAERAVQPTASGAVILLQEGEGTAPGFLIYMPVFEGVGAFKRLKGFIYSPFNAGDFLSSAADLVDRAGMGVALYDSGSEFSRPMATIGLADTSGKTLTQEVTVANRPMVLEVVSDRGAALSRLSMITLLFGLAVASLLMLIARLLSQQAMEDQRSLDWFAEQNSIRNSLTRELNHRVKNTLANVLSIVALTRRRSRNIDDFADGLDGRIRALSATHDLLTKSEWGTTPIASVVAAELTPYTYEDGHEIEIEGPPLELAPNDALSLGLALHELATNAVKYGALSQQGGKVSVTWELTSDGLARIQWQESGGPPVPENRQRGFGTELIRKVVAHELRQPVDLDFAPEGVSCTLLVPVRQREDFVIRKNPGSTRGH